METFITQILYFLFPSDQIPTQEGTGFILGQRSEKEVNMSIVASILGKARRLKIVYWPYAKGALQ